MNGKVECIRVIAGRKKETEQRFFTDKDFVLLDICREKLSDGFDYYALKPLCLKEMIEAAEILSAPFPFVRVDLYDNNGQVLFGEMTFTPSGCMNKTLTDEGEKLLGQKLIL